LAEERGSEREQPLAGDAVRDVPQDKLATCTHFGISSLLSRRESIPEWGLSERRNETKALCCFPIRNCSKRDFIAVPATISICVQKTAACPTRHFFLWVWLHYRRGGPLKLNRCIKIQGY